MAIKSKDEIMEALNGFLGNNTEDAALAFVEDVSDTLDDFAARTADATDWRAKYEENDAAWRARYRDRFFNKGEEQPIEDHAEAEPESEEPVDVIENFEDLFEEVQ